MWTAITVTGFNKKVAALAKQRDCQLITEWSSSLTNHLYWTAATSDGNGDLMEAKWKSITNHIENVPKGHGVLFPECLHPRLTKRKWLKPRKMSLLNSALQFYFDLHLINDFIL